MSTPKPQGEGAPVKGRGPGATQRVGDDPSSTPLESGALWRPASRFGECRPGRFDLKRRLVSPTRRLPLFPVSHPKSPSR